MKAYSLHNVLPALTAALCLAACTIDDPVPARDQQVGYRTGTADDGYLSNGERGDIMVTEINWAGSVSGTMGARVHHPDDVFIEFQNKLERPVYITGWNLIIRAAAGRDPLVESESERTFVIPEREGGGPIQPNEFVYIAARRDGAFADADYFIDDLSFPLDGFYMELRDIDDRLMDQAGSQTREPFAGSFDLVTVRSMERIQLIFSNRGTREAAWHSYSLNDWDAEHARLTRNIDEAYRALTYASPGVANTPDYSGNTSAGSFE